MRNEVNSKKAEINERERGSKAKMSGGGVRRRRKSCNRRVEDWENVQSAPLDVPASVENMLGLITSCSSNAQTESSSKNRWQTIDSNGDRRSCRWSRIAGQSLLPAQTPMCSLRSCERAQCGRRMESELRVDRDLVVPKPAQPAMPCVAGCAGFGTIGSDGQQADKEGDALQMLVGVVDARWR